jgi:type I restriction enzyme M protein
VEKKPLPHLLCTTNMLLHGIDVPSNIRHDNTLAARCATTAPADRVDVVVTNPPFGGMEEDGIEQNFPADFRTRKPPTCSWCSSCTAQGRRPRRRGAARRHLFGEGIKTRIKEKLLTECNLHTIVRLPNGVFAPTPASRPTCCSSPRAADAGRLVLRAPLPAGVKNYNKTKPMRIEEFDAEKAWWGSEADGFAARVENEQAWKVCWLNWPSG